MLVDDYLHKKQYRNYPLVIAGIHTALRIGDLLKRRWGDIYNFHTDQCKEQIHLTVRKDRQTKNNCRQPHTQTCDSNSVIPMPSGRFALTIMFFWNHRSGSRPISRVQAYRIMRAASEEIGFQEAVSCHSLRKTFGYHAWKKGIPIAVIMDIYNHSSYSITRRYLGISQDDRNQVYCNMKLLK